MRWYDAPGGESRLTVYDYRGRPSIADWRADHGLDGHSLDSGDGRFAAFAAADRNNYRLLPTSDARGAGTDLGTEWPPGVPKTDMGGHAWPEGGAWDIGAYEYSDK